MNAESTSTGAAARSVRPAGAPAGTRPRIAFWDNARFILIVLVVIGHALSTVRTDSAFAFGIYVYIYLFHMPAMILLSGLFSRPETSPKAIRATLQLLVTWLLWEGIWAVIHFSVEGKSPGDGFLVSPAWTLWFLVSLATMRILLPFIASTRYPLAISIAVSLAAGLLPPVDSDFSASRTLVFLPFFVAGWLIRERGWLDGQWFVVPYRGVRVAAWGLLVAVGLGFALVPGLRDFWRIDKRLTWRDDYDWVFRHAPLGDWMPTGELQVAAAGIGVSAFLLVVAAAMTLALLIVTPRRQSRMTTWGARTLYVYLLHGPIIWGMREAGVVEWAESFGTPGLIGLMVCAVALAVALSATWVTRVFRPVVEPSLDWLLKKG